MTAHVFFILIHIVMLICTAGVGLVVTIPVHLLYCIVAMCMGED